MHLAASSLLQRSMMAGLLLLIAVGGWQGSAPAAVQAQTDPSKSPQLPASQPSAPAATGTPAARELFGQHCEKCHGADGTGSPARGRRPEIPNFTDAAWQARTDAQLLASILDGKGKEMPAWRGQISEEQARSLATYVRAFPTTTKPKPEKQQGPIAPKGFPAEFGRLHKKLDELQGQFRQLSKPSAPAPAGAPADRELFQQHCMKCHEADGTGSQLRRGRPEIPDFTDTAWQGRRRDAQLLASILDGKGKEMPPWRGKVGEKQVRGLVAYIRAFASTTKKTQQEEQEDLTPYETEEAKPPEGFFAKLIRWLGKFHPPAVHFPIALLIAAALAELLRMVTDQPAYDAVARYCVRFGALTAVVAGVLGWFTGDFRLSDASWVMTMHRWLGTYTVACTGLALALSELSGRPDRRRTRMCFRVTLLVVAGLVLVTGFFGGAIVFGLDHYTLPP